MAGGYHNGQSKYGTFEGSKRVLLENTAIGDDPFYSRTSTVTLIVKTKSL